MYIQLSSNFSGSLKKKSDAAYDRTVTWRAFTARTKKWEDSTSWQRERKREGWIKLDPPVPKELAIATGSSQAIFNNRGTGNPWAGNAESYCGDVTQGRTGRVASILIAPEERM